MTPASITRIVRICRNVTRLDTSVAFYKDRLGFQSNDPAVSMDAVLAAELGFGTRTIPVQRMRLGEQEIEIIEAGPSARPYPDAQSAADLDFHHIAVRTTDIGAAFAQLYRGDSSSPSPTAISRSREHDPAPVRLPQRSGGVTAFKFRDPDGHPVELLQPAGYDRARSNAWAGIDHTAISVSSARASMGFYADLLGLIVSACQTNSGSEQGSLDGLENPIVDVVSLQTASNLSPHLELLGYHRPLAPVSGELANPTDIVSDRIVVACSDVFRLATNLGMVSRLVRHPATESTLVFRDPDGHFLQAIECPG